jgi:small subunit ribosomal protein S5
MEAAGIADVSAKTLGSNNPHNVLKAALRALFELKSFDEIAERRGVPVDGLRAQARSTATATATRAS